MYNCSKCSVNSEFYFSLEAHEKLNHPVYTRKEHFLCCNSYIEKRLCPEWDYETYLKVDFDDHLRNSHVRRKKKFLNKIHEEVEMIEETCANCDFKSFSKFLWTLHEYCRKRRNEECLGDNLVTLTTKSESEKALNETDIKWFSCDYKTHNTLGLETHKKNYFQCNHCSYKTNRKSSLNGHVLHKHTPADKVKWFNCDQCSYKTKRSFDLSGHLKRKHTPNNNKTFFECDHCAYKTSDNLCLKSHILFIHTQSDQIKWFKCPHCLYKSKKSSNLANHIKRKHIADDKKIFFLCDCCEYKTCDKRDLKHHVLSKHTPDDKIKWSECPYCWYKAKKSSNLVDHMRRRHTPRD